MQGKKKQAGNLLKLSAIRKRYKESGIADEIALKAKDTIVLPSPILALNYQMGGGIPYGKILELFGEESTGKTLLAKAFALVCQMLGGMVLWDDAEACWNNAWAIKNGLDPKKIELLPDENILEIISDWIADMCIYYRSILTNNEPILLVGDSIAVWETRTNMETADMDSGEDMGRRSKMIYKMLRKRRKIFAKYGICVIFINQIRKKVGATKWEDPDTTPGGMAMRFFADIRLGLYRGKKIVDDEDKKIGQKVHVRTKKNKVAPPRESIEAKVLFKKYRGNIGYDKYHWLQETLVETGVVVKKKGPRFYFNDELIAHGDLAFLKAISKDDELRAKLIAASPINTISKTRKRIEGIDKNLYPVKLKVKKDE